jgi:uncharacterized membrane protein
MVTVYSYYSRRGKSLWRGTDLLTKLGLLSIVSMALFGVAVSGTVGTGEPQLLFSAGQFIVGTLMTLVLPGAMLLRILEYETDRLELVGVLVPVLSLASTSLVLFCAHFLFRLVGLQSLFIPRTLYLLQISYVGALIFIARFSGVTGRIYTGNFVIEYRNPALFLSVLAFSTAVAGARLTTVGSRFGSTVLLVSLFSLALVPVALAWRGTTNTVHVLTIYLSALAVIFHMSLISNYVAGWDIQKTFQLASQIQQTGAWDAANYNRRVPLFTVTAVPAAISTLTGITLDWVYKIHIPVLYSFIPVGIFALSRIKLPGRVAAVAPFALIFYQRFFNNLNAKQHLGELFIISTLLVVFYVENKWKRLLLLLLAWGLVTSHYLMTFVFIGMLCAYYIGTALLRVLRVSSLLTENRKYVSLAFMPLMLVLFVSWYAYTAQSFIFDQFVIFPYRILTGFTERATETSNRTGQSLLVQTLQMGSVRKLYFLIHASILGLLSVGILHSIYHTIIGKHDADWISYLLFGIPPLALFGFSMFFTGRFGIDRAYEVMLITSAPLILIGGITLATVFRRAFGWSPDVSGARIVAVILMLFIIFNSGAAHFVMGLQTNPNPVPQSFALDRDKGWAEWNAKEVQAAKWFVAHRSTSTPAAAGNEGMTLIYRYRNTWEYDVIGSNDAYPELPDGMLFVRNHDTDVCDSLTYPAGCLDQQMTGSRVYINGHSEIYIK